MKKFYALLLTLDLLAIGTSTTMFAEGNINEAVVSSNEVTLAKIPAVIDEQRLTEALNNANKKNKKIREKMKKMASRFKQMSSKEREVYEKSMYAMTLKLNDGINKILNPAKKEESFFWDIATGAGGIVKGATKTAAQYMLATVVLCSIVAQVARTTPYVATAASKAILQYILDGWTQTLNSDAGSVAATAAGVVVSACPDYLSWVLAGFGDCAPEVLATVVNATI